MAEPLSDAEIAAMEAWACAAKRHPVQWVRKLAADGVRVAVELRAARAALREARDAMHVIYANRDHYWRLAFPNREMDERADPERAALAKLYECRALLPPDPPAKGGEAEEGGKG